MQPITRELICRMLVRGNPGVSLDTNTNVILDGRNSYTPLVTTTKKYAANVEISTLLV